MNTNLIDEANSVLTPDLLSSLARKFNLDTSALQTAMHGALPTVLGSLIQRASEPGGVSSVMDLTAQITTPDRAAGEVIEPAHGILDQLTEAATGGTDSFAHLLAMGSDAVSSLFGNRSGGVVDALAKYSGLLPTSASSVLSLAGTVMLGLLGRKMASDADGPLGMVSLLNSQNSLVRQAMPAGLSSLLALVPGLDISGMRPVGMENTPSTATTPRSPLSGPAPVFTEGQYSDHTDPADTGTSNRWLPWLLLALGAAALFFVVRSCQSEKVPNVGTSGVSLTDSINGQGSATTIGARADSVGVAISEGMADLGAFFKRKLPSGVELNIPENGIENKLVGFIEDTDKVVDKTTWFNFDRLLFDTGKATLQPASQEQLGNIANVLKAYPEVAIKLGGYTDNTGNPQANQKLSADRANTVMNELARLGIDPARLAAEGYGEQFPAATNDTEAGRAQNRRIAVRVTKK